MAPDLLFECVKAINQDPIDFIYYDENTILNNKMFDQTDRKPDFSSTILLSQNYLGPSVLVSKALFKKVITSNKDLHTISPYDFMLKATENASNIHHLRKILSYRQIASSSDPDTINESLTDDIKALNAALKRRGIDGYAEKGCAPNTYRVHYKIQGSPLISIIIPFKDKAHLLQQCITSILNKSTYQNYEIIGINNASIDKATYSTMEELKSTDKRVKFFQYQEKFNYSAINNFAVNECAQGEHIVLLNNDIEIITPDWLESLLELSQLDDVGAVGAMLYYPNNQIQHAGIELSITNTSPFLRVNERFKNRYSKKTNHYFNRAYIIQNTTCVTAACLMIKKSLFKSIGELEVDHLKVGYNDVDLCLRLLKKNYRNIFTPFCEAYHHESASRGHDVTTEQATRGLCEVNYILSKHQNQIMQLKQLVNTSCENNGH